jgi:hypothetical protein
MKIENSGQNTLLRRPRPYVDEDLAGYILRLCQINRYSSPQWIYNLAEIPHYAANGNFFDRTTRDLSQLAQLSLSSNRYLKHIYYGNQTPRQANEDLSWRTHRFSIRVGWDEFYFKYCQLLSASGFSEFTDALSST